MSNQTLIGDDNSHSNNPTNTVTDSHQAFLLLIGQLVAVSALAVIADQGAEWETAALILLAILWLLYLFAHSSQLGQILNKFTGG